MALIRFLVGEGGSDVDRGHMRDNVAQSVAIVAGMAAVVAAAAFLVAGPTGAVMGLVAVGVLTAIAPRLTPDALMRLYRARRVAPGGDPLSQLLDELTSRASLAQRPDLYIIPSATLNAFATGGGGKTAIALTEGLVRRLTLREIAGVIAHEVAHIRNHDLWLMGLADAASRFVQGLAYVAVGLAIWNLIGMTQGDHTLSWWGIALLYLAPTLMSLLQLGLSRTREFEADEVAARLTGDPAGLASALARVERYTGKLWEDMMLPVPGRRVPQPSLLRSHPPTEDRIARLGRTSPAASHARIVVVEGPMVSPAGFGPADIRPRYRFPGLWY
ncbi:MAG: zinc metalloprotease HtpX [Hyphomicrobiaceae bacterium]|nr:zinc metalloprotease HtpX [Hyphomicrobiaceae bacterium]